MFIAFAGALTAVASELVTLTNAEGHEIKATLVNLNNEQLTIRMEDGRSFTFPVATLDEDSQEIVRQWQILQIVARDLRISYNDKKIGTVDSDDGIYIIDREQTVIEVDLENKSRTALEGLRVEYNALIKREPLGGSDDAGTAEHFERLRGAMEALRLEPRQRLSLQSEVFEIRDSKLDSSYYFAGDGQERAKDKIEGIWIRLYIGDILVFEESRPRAFSEENGWEQPRD